MRQKLSRIQGPGLQRYTTSVPLVRGRDCEGSCTPAAGKRERAGLAAVLALSSPAPIYRGATQAAQVPPLAWQASPSFDRNSSIQARAVTWGRGPARELRPAAAVACDHWQRGNRDRSS